MTAMSHTPTPTAVNGRAPTLTAGPANQTPAAPAATPEAPTPPAPPAASPAALIGRPTRRQRRPNLHDQSVLGAVFYSGVLIVALVGSTDAATHWLDTYWYYAAPAVLLVEIGGVYLSDMADARRRLGERAIPARVLSAAVALGAVALNLFGHLTTPIQAGFFAGMSALGYAVWLIQSGYRRRDALRTAGKLAAPPPVYGLNQWLTHPVITRKARDLAKRDATLGRDESLEAVRLQGALGAFFRRRLLQTNDPETAEALLSIYDPDVLARELRSRVDWTGFAEMLARDIDPARAMRATPTQPRAGGPDRTTSRASSRPGGNRPPASSTAAPASKSEGDQRRSTADTYAAYERLVESTPDRTERWYAEQLGISDGRLRAVKRDGAGRHPTTGRTNP